MTKVVVLERDIIAVCPHCDDALVSPLRDFGPEWSLFRCALCGGSLLGRNANGEVELVKE